MKAADRPAIKAIMEHRAAHKPALAATVNSVQAAAVDGSPSSSDSQDTSSNNTDVPTSVPQAAFEKAGDSTLPYGGDLTAAMKAADRPAIKAIMEFKAAQKAKPAVAVAVEAAVGIDSANAKGGVGSYGTGRADALPYAGDLQAAMKAADRPAIKLIMEHRAAQKAKQLDAEAAHVKVKEASASDGESDESSNEGGSNELHMGGAERADLLPAAPASNVSGQVPWSAAASASAEGELPASILSSGKPQRSQSPPAPRPKSHTVESKAAAVAVRLPSPPQLEQRDAALRARAAAVEARTAAAANSERDAEERRKGDERQSRGEAARARMEARKAAGTSKSPNRAKSPARK